MNDTTQPKSFIESMLGANPHLREVLQAIEPVKPRVLKLYNEAKAAYDAREADGVFSAYGEISKLIRVETTRAGWHMDDLTIGFLRLVIFESMGLREL